MTKNTALMCKQQEAIHRKEAAEALLPNIRKISLRAAAAWELQAEEAMQAETGNNSALSPDDAAIVLEFQQENEEYNDLPEKGTPTDQIA